MIPLFKVFMSETVIEPLKDVLLSGSIGQGRKVREFEESLQTFLQNKYALTVNSGTSALTLALRLLRKPGAKIAASDSAVEQPVEPWPGLADGDEVLTTPLTCTATNWAVLANNLRIKWVDVEPSTGNMDLVDLARKITSKTKVILVVHWGGTPVDLDALKAVQLESRDWLGIKPLVIEDAAHALGAEYKGKKIGSHGNVACFSFQAIKHVTSGDGGLLALPGPELYERGKRLRWYGIDREARTEDFRCEEDIPEWGYKYHMNDINATIGLANLSHLQWMLHRHRENASFYNEHWGAVPGITLLEDDPNKRSAYWIYTLRAENRDGLMKSMKDAGIMVSRVHERNDIHSAVKEFRALLPNLDRLTREMLCIPVGWWITAQERQYIVDVITKGW